MNPANYQDFYQILIIKLSGLFYQIINTQKSVAFLYTNDEILDRECKKKLFRIIKIKPRNKCDQGGKDLNTENYKTLIKEI